MEINCIGMFASDERVKNFKTQMNATNSALKVLKSIADDTFSKKLTDEFRTRVSTSFITDDIDITVSAALAYALAKENAAAVKEIVDLLRGFEARRRNYSEPCCSIISDYLIGYATNGGNRDFLKDTLRILSSHHSYELCKSLFKAVLICTAVSNESMIDDILSICNSCFDSKNGYSTSFCIYAAVYLKKFDVADTFASIGGTLSLDDLMMLLCLRAELLQGDKSDKACAARIDKLLSDNKNTLYRNVSGRCYIEMSNMFGDYPRKDLFPPCFRIERIGYGESLYDYIGAIEKDDRAEEIFAETLTICSIPCNARETSKRLAELLPDVNIFYDVTNYNEYYDYYGINANNRRYDVLHIIEKCDLIYDAERMDGFGKAIMLLNSAPIASAAVKKGIINEKNIDEFIEFASDSKCLRALRGITKAL